MNSQLSVEHAGQLLVKILAAGDDVASLAPAPSHVLLCLHALYNLVTGAIATDPAASLVTLCGLMLRARSLQLPWAASLSCRDGVGMSKRLVR
jgi:hypothetical protein